MSIVRRKERPADTAPETRPNLGRIKNEVSREHTIDTLRPGPSKPTKRDLKRKLAKQRGQPPQRPGTDPAPTSPEQFSNPATNAERAVPTAKATGTARHFSSVSRAEIRDKNMARPGRADKSPKAGRLLPKSTHATKRESYRPVQAMRQRLKRQAVRRAAQRGARGAASHTTKTVARKGATVALRVIQAAARAGAALFGAVAGFLGGGTLLVVILLVAMVGAMISSPFGILFSNQNHDPDVIPVSLAVGQIDQAFSSYLNGLQSGGNYDDVEIHGQKADWVEVLAVFAVKTTLYDGESAADVVTLDADRVNRLSAIFWDMNPVRTRVQRIETTNDETGEVTTTYILHEAVPAGLGRYLGLHKKGAIKMVGTQKRPPITEKKIGQTTYLVTSHFPEYGSTAADKIKRLIDTETKTKYVHKTTQI